MTARGYRFWACCIDMPGELVGYITDYDRTQGITYGTFARHADVSTLPGGRKHDALYRASCTDNWAISFWRSSLPSGTRVYYFDWSRIEHVFVRQAPDLALEMRILESQE